MFAPRNGVAQWRVLYEHMRKMDIGQVVTWQELQALLPDVKPEGLRPAFQRALKEIETEDRRSFASVRGVGYRMVAANQHEQLARRKHRTARRVLDGALRKTEAADRSQLDPDERRRLDQLQQHLMAHKSMLDQLKRRQMKVEERVGFQEKETLKLDDRLRVVEDRTDRALELEAKLRKLGLLGEDD